MKLSILYRGPLSSCNYGCAYCPFAMRRESRVELERDRRAVERFAAWVEGRGRDQLSVLFTPWGEALTRRWYRDALVRLSRMPNVARVAAQTNLSCPLEWVEEADRGTLALWATYHPTEVARASFVAKCLRLRELGVRFSVGLVGTRAHREEAEALRRELPDDVYLWINAYKRVEGAVGEEDLRAFRRIDPLFPFNAVRHPSLGRACRAGRSVIAVDGDGVMRRCHFVPGPIGNIYEDGFEEALVERPCPNATCGCHIGYVHLDDLGLYDVFGDGVLERIPRTVPRPG